MTFVEDGATKVNVHAVGTVWATVLWDLAWKYIEKYGFDSDVYSGNGGNNKVLQLVTDGLKLQPCNPSFITGRDALLLADRETTGGIDNCLIWEVFARRGLGIHASAGLNSGVSAINDQVEDFTMPQLEENCTTYFGDPTVRIYPNPSHGLLNIAINNYTDSLSIRLFDINGRKVYEKSMPNFRILETIDTSQFQSGIYFLKVEGNDINVTKKIILN